MLKRLKVAVMTILLGSVFFYCGLLGMLYFNQRNMVFYADRSAPPLAENAQLIEVPTPDGLLLKAWYFSSDNPDALVVLLFHGNGGNISMRDFKANDLLDEGVDVLLAEYRGYGGNPGKPNEQGLYNDARGYIAWLGKEKGVKPEQTILFGESLGTGVSVQLATEFQFKALILESAYSSLPDIAKRIYFYVPVDLLMKDQFRSIDKIKQVHAPILFIHGGRDKTIPMDIGKKLYDAANGPKTFIIVPGAEHNNLHDYGAQLHIQEFLRNITKQ